ncbi:MAG: hypothetical protein QF475_00845 [Candidatus Undinarchaeales archaeon]|jgi:hypothetical protein|nr:hypothetical protein [Candidatus Undinarchaeales archaeon]
MTKVEELRIQGDTYNYSIIHNTRELHVSFPKTNVVYGNAPFMGDIRIEECGGEVGRLTWYGIKHVLDKNADMLDNEIKLKGLSKWDLHDILTAIKKYETNYKTRKLSIGMYNDLENVTKAIYYLVNKF